MAFNDTKKFFEELVRHEEPEEVTVEVEEVDVDVEDDEEEAEEQAPIEIDEDSAEGQLAIDVYRSGDDIIVESPIAGVDPTQIDIQITSEEVTVTGTRARFKEISDEDYYHQECYWGQFSRSVILPEEVNADEADATIKNGILRIKMPLLNRKKGKKIKVKAA